MQQIPVQPSPVQTFLVTLGAQACQVNLYQKTSGLYCDLLVNGTSIITGQLCQNLNRLVRDQYLGFIGDLGFYDVTGEGEDPNYTGLGSRFMMLYLEQTDIVYGNPFFNVGAVVGTTYA
jgi:hypothetical protein